MRKALFAIGTATVLTLAPHSSDAGQNDITKELKKCSIQYLNTVAPNSAYEVYDTKDGFSVGTSEPDKNKPYVYITHATAKNPTGIRLSQVIDGEHFQTGYDYDQDPGFKGGLGILILKQGIERNLLEGITSEKEKQELLKQINKDGFVYDQFAKCMPKKETRQKKLSDQLVPK